MGKKSIAKNYLYNLSFQVLTVILPLITTPYVSRVLGAEKIGIYSYTSSVVTYFILAGSLGTMLYGQREIAYVQNDKEARTKLFWELVIMRFFTIIIASIVYYFFLIRGRSYQEYYKILYMEILATAFDISWFFRGMEDFKKTVTRNIIVRLVSVSCVFIFVKNPADLSKYVFIYSLGNMLGSLSLWLYIPKYLTGVKIKNIDIYKHFMPVVMLFIPQVSTQVSSVLDKTMLGYMILDKAEAGYYEQVQKILRILIALTTSLGVVMMPRIANSFAAGDKRTVHKYMKKSIAFTFFLSFPMILGLISISDAFVPVFFGKGFDKAIILMKIISPTILLIGLNNVIGVQYLLSVKMQREYTISVVCGLIANFIMNYILIKLFSSIGATIATIISEGIVVGVQLYFARDTIRFRKIIRLSLKYIVASFIMYGACRVVKAMIPSGIISILIQVIVGIVVYMGILIFFNRGKKRRVKKRVA